MCRSASSRASPVGVGDDHVARERPLGERRSGAGRRAVGEERCLPASRRAQVRGRAGDPVVGQGGRAAEGDVAPAADPDRADAAR